MAKRTAINTILSTLTLAVVFVGAACGHYDEVVSSATLNVNTPKLDGTAVVVTNEFGGDQLIADDTFANGVANLEPVVTGKPSNFKLEGAPCNDLTLRPMGGGTIVINTITLYDGENANEYWVDWGVGCGGVDQCDDDADCGGGMGFQCVKGKNGIDQCEPNCKKDSDCHGDDVCDIATKECKPKPDDTTGTDSDTGGGSTGGTDTGGADACSKDEDCEGTLACILGSCKGYTLCGPTDTESWTLYSNQPYDSVDLQDVLWRCEDDKPLNDVQYAATTFTIPGSLGSKGVKFIGGDLVNSSPAAIPADPGWMSDVLDVDGPHENQGYALTLLVSSTPKP